MTLGSTSHAPSSAWPVAVIGGGPAGLMAADVLSSAGVAVHLFDAMPSVGRKFLLAGKGGLNLTHSEPIAAFVTRYGLRQPEIELLLSDFNPSDVRAWAAHLGVDTFVGSSGRVFPTGMKAAPLLRTWLQRLRHPEGSGVPVHFHMRHRWTGWQADSIHASPDASGPASQTLCFDGPLGPTVFKTSAVVLALGGGSWARLGSDGSWVPILQARGVAVAPLQPANCGFDVLGGWSDYFRTRFAGEPFKSVAIRFAPTQVEAFHRKGEFVATATGIEGSVVYAAAGLLRDEIAQRGSATLLIDLLPDMPLARVQAELEKPRGSRTLASHLKTRLNLQGIKLALLHELLSKDELNQPERLAKAIKATPIVLGAARPMDEAISTAGGVGFEGLTPDLMLRAADGVFCAGEMADWEAPTGGYLLTACLASGRRAASGVLRYLAQAKRP